MATRWSRRWQRRRPARRYSEERVTNFSEFVRIVERVKERWWAHWSERVDPWFRGVSDTSYSLVPGVYRPPIVNSKDFDEDDYRDEFTLRAYRYLSDTAIPPRTDWDWYFLMQHYGMPTRLLDWSEGGAHALYFALRDRRDTDAAVWMLDPFWLNGTVARWAPYILDVTQRKARGYLRPTFSADVLPRLPMAIQPPFQSPRITAQKGMFTIHGRGKRGLEKYRFGDHLVKVVIPRASAARMMNQLGTLGITETVVFPELEALSREIVNYWAEFEPTERTKIAAAPTVSRRPARIRKARGKVTRRTTRRAR
jgi:FRG domain